MSTYPVKGPPELELLSKHVTIFPKFKHLFHNIAQLYSLEDLIYYTCPN